MDVLGEQKGTVTSAVIEGARHPDMLRAIEAAFGGTLSVYLDVPDNIRYERWLNREGADRSPKTLRTFSQLSNADVERHVYGLREMASLVIDGSLDPDVLVARLLSWARNELR
jgi:hypothetical protein